MEVKTVLLTKTVRKAALTFRLSLLVMLRARLMSLLVASLCRHSLPRIFLPGDSPCTTFKSLLAIALQYKCCLSH